MPACTFISQDIIIKKRFEKKMLSRYAAGIFYFSPHIPSPARSTDGNGPIIYETDNYIIHIDQEGAYISDPAYKAPLFIDPLEAGDSVRPGVAPDRSLISANSASPYLLRRPRRCCSPLALAGGST